MARAIFKWTLQLEDEQVLSVPVGTKLLSVQMQHGSPQVWGICFSPASSMKKITVFIHGTGHPITREVLGRFLGTFQMKDGTLVFHVFVED